MDEGDDDHKAASPQSIKSKGEETADASVGDNEGDQTEEDDRDGEGEGDEDDVEDMEE